MYTPLFSPLYHFPSIADTQPRDAPVKPPMRHSRAFAITCSPRSPSLTPLICRTIGPALRMGCTGDLRTSLLHFSFQTGPHVVFLMIISFSDLLIHHRDMRQFPPVTRLALTRADRFKSLRHAVSESGDCCRFAANDPCFRVSLTSLFVFNRL